MTINYFNALIEKRVNGKTKYWGEMGGGKAKHQGARREEKIRMNEELPYCKFYEE